MGISRDEHRQLIDRQLDGELTISIDTASFRQFLVKADPAKLSELFEVTLHGRLRILRVLLNLEVILLPAVLIFSAVACRWWAFVVAPAIALVWMFYKAFASRGRQRLLPMILLVAIICVVLASIPSVPVLVRALVLSIAVLLLTTRALYWYTANLVFSLVHTNHRFFNEFYEGSSDCAFPFISIQEHY